MTVVLFSSSSVRLIVPLVNCTAFACENSPETLETARRRVQHFIIFAFH